MHFIALYDQKLLQDNSQKLANRDKQLSIPDFYHFLIHFNISMAHTIFLLLMLLHFNGEQPMLFLNLLVKLADCLNPTSTAIFFIG